MWNFFKGEWNKWCSTRKEMKTDKEKKELNPAPPTAEKKEELTEEEKTTINSGGYF
jgi:hypothetical protein